MAQHGMNDRYDNEYTLVKSRKFKDMERKLLPTRPNLKVSALLGTNHVRRHAGTHAHTVIS